MTRKYTKSYITIPERIAAFFEKTNAQATIETLADLLYPDEEFTDYTDQRIRCHMTNARKILRKKGIFLTDPRKHNGEYRVEKDPDAIVKKAKTGRVRAENGFNTIVGGHVNLINTPEYAMQLVKAAAMLSEFVNTVSMERISALTGKSTEDLKQLNSNPSKDE